MSAAITIAKMLREDPRYKLGAYEFVFESLGYAHKELGLGGGTSREEEPDEENPSPERHLTGQQLCEAIRLFALDQFGFMAKCVLNSWGVKSSRDFGNIVFNLIKAGQMRKTAEDRIEDFENVFDFDTGLAGEFQFRVPKSLSAP